MFDFADEQQLLETDGAEPLVGSGLEEEEPDDEFDAVDLIGTEVREQ